MGKAFAASIDPNAPVSSGDSVSYGGMLIEGVKSLFGLMEPTQKFTDVKSLMISAFFSVPVSAVRRRFYDLPGYIYSVSCGLFCGGEKR